jgi:hypothetical protein
LLAEPTPYKDKSGILAVAYSSIAFGKPPGSGPSTTPVMMRFAEEGGSVGAVVGVDFVSKY